MSKKVLSRREFVRIAGATSAVISTPALLSGCSDDGDSGATVNYGVIVIGAGAAGLVIGNALTTAGVNNVVLEARSRVGGRVYAPELAGVPVDVGGMWISGPEGNPAACVINNEGLGWQAAEPIGLTTRGYDAVLARSLTLAELLPAALAQDDFDTQYADIASSLPPGSSLGDAVSAYLAGSTLTGDARRYAEFGLNTGIEIDTAESASLVSLIGNPSSALGGGEHFPDGTYAGLIDALKRGVDVRLDTAVSDVSYDEAGVSVTTSQGTFRGTHVVVTVPLGVLKAGGMSFSPPLPPAKQSAIDRLAMGQLEKVVLRYDTAFWPEPGLGNFLYLSKERGEFPLIADYSAFASGAPTIVGFYCGDYGRSIGGETDAAIVHRLVDIMGEIAGVPGVAPTASYVTRWKSDPYAGGSYSYLPIGATPDDFTTLAEPVGERLLFAGEATSLAANGFVHGAVLSGIREAERLLGRVGQGVELESGLLVQLGCNEEA